MARHKDALAHTRSVYHVLLQLYNRLPLGAFFRLIEDGGSNLAPASRLLQVYAREQNSEMLRDFYYSDDRRVESAVLCLEEARRMKASCGNFLVCTSKSTSVAGPRCEDHVDQSGSKVLLGGQRTFVRSQGMLPIFRPARGCMATTMTHMPVDDGRVQSLTDVPTNARERNRG
jgi:hypothetical protein